jgi:hypothetical protein
MSRKPLAAALAVLLFAGVAFAATYVPLEQRFTPAQMHETGLDTLSPEQLARLNALLREEATASAASAPPSASAAHDAAEFRDREIDRGLLGLGDTPIHARVQGTVTGWGPGTVFALDNGQQWKVLKGEMTLREPLESPETVVMPGVAGRWFLQVDDDLPKARVYRVD